MNMYVRWFCETFLGKEYEDKPLFSFWLSKHERQVSVMKCSNYKINTNLKQNEQMTIFDF